ncbi:MAG: Druantia anti-phage system protein DruA [Candidatus Sedimenticola endophacoides]
MQAHHYLGALVKIGNTIRYVAERKGRWVGLLSISASALKCAARDQWIGWGYRHQYDRLNLVANNNSTQRAGAAGSVCTLRVRLRV